ncbi:MAG TPA: hypothetical protein VGE09_08440 [Pseudoxanthomonas sp.]
MSEPNRLTRCQIATEEGPRATTEPPWGWESKEPYTDLKAAYLACDASLDGIAKRFGMSRWKLNRLIRILGWPKRRRYYPPESTARRLEMCKALGVYPGRKRTRPLPGTEDGKIFRKIADRCGLGAAAAHAELRRGA